MAMPHSERSTDGISHIPTSSMLTSDLRAMLARGSACPTHLL